LEDRRAGFQPDCPIPSNSKIAQPFVTQENWNERSCLCQGSPSWCPGLARYTVALNLPPVISFTNTLKRAQSAADQSFFRILLGKGMRE
jgi:hypothetical protein